MFFFSLYKFFNKEYNFFHFLIIKKNLISNDKILIMENVRSKIKQIGDSKSRGRDAT